MTEPENPSISLEEAADYYARFMRKEHAEPDIPQLNGFLKESGIGAELAEESWSRVRELAFKNNEDLQDFALNDSYFTDEYFDNLQEALKTHKKFIISTAVLGKAAKVDFFKAMQNWAKQNNAAVLILPSLDIKSSHKVFRLNFDPMFKEENTWIILNKDMEDNNTISTDETPDGYYLNKHLWLSTVKTQAKVVNPISGWDETVTSKDASIIVSSPKQYLKNVAALKCKTPKAVMSTGACTVNNYKNDLGMSQKSSARAKEAHKFGAIIVEVQDDNLFHFRQVQMKNGSFTDLYAKYTPDGNVTLAKDTVLVMGDSHAGATDMTLLKDILNKLVAYGSISEIVLHDLCDSRPVSPHDQGKCMTRALQYQKGQFELKKLFTEIVDYLNLITDLGVKVTVVASNHDEHLNRALEKLPQWLADAPNSETLIKMAGFYFTNRLAPLLEFCVKNIPDVKLRNPERIKWLQEDESYVRHGCELGQHGHAGTNGSKGSLKQYSCCVGNAVIGHSHSSGIIGDAFQVGTTSELDQGYNKGLSSWTRTCCLVHADGTKQLINFIPNGRGGYSFKIED